MFVVHVYVDVKSEFVDGFKAASLANAQSSVNEPGIARFDVIQDLTEPTQFVLVEVYRTEADSAKHKETEHYRTWRDTVAPMMNSPRSARKFSNIFPDETGWASK
jgi:(4S)-4-hydroxy-5-phosphonooxypentane-2,3-dione isomerase